MSLLLLLSCAQNVALLPVSAKGGPTSDTIERLGDAGDGLGSALAAGDLDGDGWDDLVVTNPGAGRVDVYRGGSSGVEAVASWSLAPTTPGATFGAALVVGDLDGDGVADLAIGEPGHSATAAEQGAVHLYRGGAGGPQAWSTRRGDAASAAFGSALAVGDVNADGYGDLAVGSPGYGSAAGRVALFLGSAAGAGSRHAWRTTDRVAGSELGAALAFADVDADGDDDLAVGSPARNDERGAVFVWLAAEGTLPANAAFIPKSGSRVGDRTGATVVNLGALDGLAQHVLGVGTPNYQYPSGVVVGRLSGHRLSDGAFDQPYTYDWLDEAQVGAGAGTAAVAASGAVLVGAPGAGAVALYRGEAPVWSAALGGEAGAALAVGDFDGDGHDDVAIGAPGYEDSAAGQGAVWIVPGLAVDADGDGAVAVVDCDDTDATALPGALEVCDGVDQDCNGAVDDGAVDATSWWPDADGDGYGAGEALIACPTPAGYADQDGDCNDRRVDVHPGVTDIRGDRLDRDCDGWDGEDRDSDGYDVDAGDCDDLDASRNPGATDADGDGVDANCDGADGQDVDGDGWTASEAGGWDCDDLDAAVLPWTCADAADLVVDGATVTLSGALSYRAVWVVNGGRIEVAPYAPSTGWLSLTAGIVLVDDTSSIVADAKGYRGGGGRGGGPGGGLHETLPGGGGFGGEGGPGMSSCSSTRGRGGATYGAASDGVLRLGSGGGGQSTLAGGSGGGAIGLYADEVILAGALMADGGDGAYDGSLYAAGGAGGSVIVDAGSLSCTGAVSADGGADACNDQFYADCSGAGGGGRVQIVYDAGANDCAVTAAGGNGYCEDGDAGSVWIAGP